MMLQYSLLYFSLQHCCINVGSHDKLGSYGSTHNSHYPNSSGGVHPDASAASLRLDRAFGVGWAGSSFGRVATKASRPARSSSDKVSSNSCSRRFFFKAVSQQESRAQR